jgi:hypothetical protein
MAKETEEAPCSGLVDAVKLVPVEARLGCAKKAYAGARILMTRKPHEVLPPPSQGDLDGTLILTQVGRALSLWEGLEDEIAEIFVVLVGATTTLAQDAAKKAYGSVTAFQGRQKMVMAAAEVFFSHFGSVADQRAAKLFMDKCAHFSARRNEIAHGIVRKLDFNSEAFDRKMGC